MGRIFEHSSAGYVELMQSAEMRACLHEFADGVKAGAEANLHPDKSPMRNDPYYTYDISGNDRAGVGVVTGNPHSMMAELDYGPLQNAAGV